MNTITKSLGAILILGAAVGCESEPEVVTPATPVQTVNPKPVPSTAKPGGMEATGGDSKVVTPPPPKDTGKPDTDKKDSGAPKVEAPKTSDTAKPDAKAVKLTADETAAIKELPASEQAAALAQTVCPVSNHNLGSMGKPLKVTAEGRTFYLCCDSCEPDLKANPKAVIAKLDKNKEKK